MYRLNDLSSALVNVWNQAYRKADDKFKSNLDLISMEHKNMLKNEARESKKYLFVERTIKDMAKNNTLNSPYKELLEAIYEANYMISWYPNSTFEDEEIAIANENYCANLIGRISEIQSHPYVFHNENIMGGLFLMGPNQVYPHHYHPASETWIILSGRSKWQRDDGQWEIKKPEDQFTFKENESHSTRTKDEPLLALWAWTGDLSSWARWTKV